jgi:hypothetical protein
MAKLKSTTNSKIPLAALVYILLLSLATWYFFYATSVPLDSGATTVVVGIWTGIVWLTRWAWHKYTHREVARR